MLTFLFAFGLLFQTAAAPGPLSAQQVLDAHRANISAQGMLNMIAASPSVTPASEAELAALTQAGVPASVVEAFRARLAPAVPPVSAPDDSRLEDIVRLVNSGLSEELIIRQIRSSGENYRLSIGDLIFLKNKQVPEAVIAALITSSAGASTPPPAVKPTVFGPLLKMKGFLKKDAPGTLRMNDGRLDWLDGKKPERNFALEIASIKSSWLECSPRAQGNFCYAVGLELFNGDQYEFRDLTWETGDNAQVLALTDALKKGYPQIVYHERVK